MHINDELVAENEWTSVITFKISIASCLFTTYIQEIIYTKDNNEISYQVIILDSDTEEAFCAWFQIEHDFSVTYLKAQNV